MLEAVVKSCGFGFGVFPLHADFFFLFLAVTGVF
jgi:hypothetical protein